MVNPGGPGTSNAEFALTPSYFSPEIQARFDIVGVDARAMLLDSNIDHSVDLRHFTVDRAAAADDAFLELVHWCDRTATCVLHGQDVLATWQQALDAADLHRCPETGCGTGCSATCTARRTTTSPS
jgi:hypothetical protein